MRPLKLTLRGITRYAQEVGSYDKRNTLEAAGGKVLEMSQNAWEAVASLS